MGRQRMSGPSLVDVGCDEIEESKQEGGSQRLLAWNLRQLRGR